MLLKDVRDYISSISVAADENCYCGILTGKEDKSIGVYNLKRPPAMKMPAGGLENRSYKTKAVSVLIHWNKSPAETEQAAIRLHKALVMEKGVPINGWDIKFIRVAHAEPIPVGTDDKGVHEYVIECEIYYGAAEGGS